MAHETIKVYSELPGRARSRLSALRQVRMFSLMALVALYGCGNKATEEAPSSTPQARLRADIISFQKTTENLPPPVADEKFTEFIRNYIPAGITFSDAEAFLAQAGFMIDTDPYHIPKRTGHHDQTHAFLVTGGNFFSTTRAHVYLHPAVPGNFDRVGLVTASITVDMP